MHVRKQAACFVRHRGQGLPERPKLGSAQALLQSPLSLDHERQCLGYDCSTRRRHIDDAQAPVASIYNLGDKAARSQIGQSARDLGFIHLRVGGDIPDRGPISIFEHGQDAIFSEIQPELAFHV
jgi:hypothetical protein